MLLGAKADLNRLDDCGDTVLGAACQHGHESVVRLLVQCKAAVNSHVSGISPLCHAASYNHTEVVRLLLHERADCMSFRVSSPLYLAAGAEDGCTGALELLLAAGAHVDVGTVSVTRRAPPLHGAAQRGNLRAVKLLLHAKATPTGAVCAAGVGTSLFVAAKNGHAGIVRLLLGAKAVSTSTKSDTPAALNVAALYGHTGVVRLLLGLVVAAEAGASAPADKFDTSAALEEAAARGHTGIVRLLLEVKARADIPLTPLHDRTAASRAVRGNHVDVLRMLLQAKTCVCAGRITASGRVVPLVHDAVGTRHTGALQLLLKAGPVCGHFAPLPHLHARTLNSAVKRAYNKGVRLLIEAKADVNASVGDDDCTGQGESAGRGAGQGEAQGESQGAGQGEAQGEERCLDAVGGQKGTHHACSRRTTPLFSAAQCGGPKVLKILLDAKARVDVSALCPCTTTPMFEAVRGAQYVSVCALVAAKCDVNAAVVQCGWSLLHEAAAMGHANVARELVRRGATRSAATTAPFTWFPPVQARNAAFLRRVVPAGATPLDVANLMGTLTYVWESVHLCATGDS
jgi:ankyrin repeat protein